MTDPIVLSPEHFRALRRLKGLAATGISALVPDMREEMVELATEAHDVIAKALASVAPGTPPVAAPAPEVDHA